MCHKFEMFDFLNIYVLKILKSLQYVGIKAISESPRSPGPRNLFTSIHTSYCEASVCLNQHRLYLWFFISLKKFLLAVWVSASFKMFLLAASYLSFKTFGSSPLFGNSSVQLFIFVPIQSKPLLWPAGYISLSHLPVEEGQLVTKPLLQKHVSTCRQGDPAEWNRRPVGFLSVLAEMTVDTSDWRSLRCQRHFI